MRYLILLTLLFVSCSTEPDNCDVYTFDSYGGYMENHVYRFDSNGLHYFTSSEYYELEKGNKYEVCLNGVDIISKPKRY